MRIIGGQWKRTPLPVLDRPGLRPTPARVRETLFNWLGQDLQGWHCVDAFAGSGALGFEAASRGAQAVLMVELDRGLVQQLQAFKTRLQAPHIRVEQGDGTAALRRCAPGSQHLVLLDPPFANPAQEPVLQAARDALADTGFIYLEAPTPWSDARLAPLGLWVYRQAQAGMVHFHLLKKALLATEPIIG